MIFFGLIYIFFENALLYRVVKYLLEKKFKRLSQDSHVPSKVIKVVICACHLPPPFQFSFVRKCAW